MGKDRTVVVFTCDRTGVGQSMALASIALLLAANGRRVLAIDWDLAKPSLAKYFTPFLPPDALTRNDGVLDVVWAYSSALRQAQPTDVPALQRHFAAVSPIELAIPDELRVRKGGVLHFFSAGREPQRRLRLRYFSWVEFFDRLDGDGLLATLLGELKRGYDHILIDCPQFSHSSRFPILSAEILIPCFTLDRESMEAGAALVRRAGERLTNRQLSVWPLTMRVLDAESALLTRALQYRDHLFQQLEQVAVFPSAAEFNAAIEVPEMPFYAYHRVLPPLAGIERWLGGPLSAYRRLAGALIDQPELQWKAPNEQQAIKYRSASETPTGTFMAPVVQSWLPPYSGDEAYAFVSYARDDRDEVMPVLQELLNLDWRLWWDEEIPGGSDWAAYLRSRIQKASLMLVFLSARAVRSKWVAEEIRWAHQIDKSFLSIRLDWSEASEDLKHILSRYQILDKSATDFYEQLGRGMQRSMKRE